MPNRGSQWRGPRPKLTLRRVRVGSSMACASSATDEWWSLRKGYKTRLIGAQENNGGLGPHHYFRATATPAASK